MPLGWEEIQANAMRFAKRWKTSRNEESDAQTFQTDFFRVFGVAEATAVGGFEYKVPLEDGRAGYIDYLWKGKIAVEMKSRGKNLNAAYEQLKEYVFHLPAEDMPDVLMVCDFASIVLYYRSTGEKHAFKVKDLKKHIRRFAAIAGYETTRICEHQTEVNVRAAEKMAKLYDALKACGYEGHALEVYLVRLLFCLFADDTGIFPKDSLANYIENAKVDGSDLSEHISRLFETLNLPEETRKKRVLLSPDLLQFRYINGGLFADPLPFADFDAKMRAILLECCRFDWNKIPPAIFGAMFQGVMDEQMRRELGAHYTSEENILKLINPLFMDALRAEFEQVKYDEKRLTQFHDKIAGLRFLDPACGCGNFLMVAYRDLRRLELDILRMQLGALRQRVTEVDSLLKVKVGQFYGIECEDFPCQIAQVGMWLMDHQMNLAVSEAFGAYYARLPLTQSATLVCGNALTLDWEAIVPKTELSYILGNPPFVGASMMSAVQKTDAVSIFGKIKLSNSIDYVGAWYHKTDRFIQDTSIRVAFVSTNSITQGEQVAPLWSKLFSEYNIHIDFCYRTFKWSNEAKGKAAVHCVIIGFSNHPDNDAKIIYENDGSKTRAANINAYLVDAPNILISSRSEPICPVPRMYLGNKPADGGNLILTANEKDEILAKEPQTGKFIKRYLGATEYINGNERYCIWLKDVAFQEVKDCPIILDKIGKVRKFRLKSSAKPTVEKAETPHLFFFISQPDSDYLLVPSTSSEHRKYIPVGYMDKNTISSNANMIIPGATLYHFGILTSSVHMAWTRAICGRLKSDYRYTGVVVYNNFPWPDATAEQTGEISVAAQKPLMQEVCIPKVRLRICTAKIPCRSTRNWSKRIRLWINSSCKSTASPPKPPNPKSSPP